MPWINADNCEAFQLLLMAMGEFRRAAGVSASCDGLSYQGASRASIAGRAFEEFHSATNGINHRPGRT
jgi:hypothetical protein